MQPNTDCGTPYCAVLAVIGTEFRITSIEKMYLSDYDNSASRTTNWNGDILNKLTPADKLHHFAGFKWSGFSPTPSLMGRNVFWRPAVNKFSMRGQAHPSTRVSRSTIYVDKLLTCPRRCILGNHLTEHPWTLPLNSVVEMGKPESEKLRQPCKSNIIDTFVV